MGRIKILNPYKQLNKKELCSFLFGDAFTKSLLKHSFKSLSKYYQRFPMFECIEIETINRCNGDCSFCPVNRNNEPRPFKVMEDSVFQKIINELSILNDRKRIAFHSNNEPYLDEKIIQRIEYARKRCPEAHLFIYTNGTLLNTQRVIDSIDAGLDHITINNYSDDLVIHNNIQDIISEMNGTKYQKYVTKIVVVLRKLNEIISNRAGCAPNKNVNNFKEYLLCQAIGCTQPFRKLAIRPTGEVSVCCNDAFGKMTMGDIRNQTLKKIWNGTEFNNLRRELLIRGRKNIELCKTCDVVEISQDFRIVFQSIAQKATNVLPVNN